MTDCIHFLNLIRFQSPGKFQKSFNDGASKLIAFDDGTCPKNKRGKTTYCKQDAFDNWFETDTDQITLGWFSFERHLSVMSHHVIKHFIFELI